MKEQHLNLSQKQLSIMESERYDQIAELIAEAPTYTSIINLSQYVREKNHEKWSQVKKELKNMLIVSPEKIYTSENFLSADKLLMVRDLFRQEEKIEQVFFQNQVGVILLAVTQGYLQQQLTAEQTSKIKQYFAKNIKKQPHFWGLGQLQSLQNYICDSSTGYFPALSTSQHQLQLDRFFYLTDFCLNYSSMFPQSTDIWSVMFKIMLCLREEKQRDKSLMVTLKKLYFESKYHYQSTLKNMKFALQFFRNIYAEKQCMYYPQRSILSILERYSQQQIENLLQSSCLGLKWSTSEIYNYFVACIKLGITESTSKMMLAMIKFCEKHNKYNELIYNYQNNISRLFIFLKYPKLYGITAKILKYFILSPTPQLTLYQKFVEKAIPLATSISKQSFFPFLNLLQAVAFLYKDTTAVTDLTTTIDSVLSAQVNKLTEQQLKNEINQYNWKVTVKAKALKSVVQKQAGYRGLLNIGNSCYLNSFIQSLFMNREFCRYILTVSTLELEKQRLTTDPNKGKDPTGISKSIRQDLRPLAELQRLFALLLTSKKTDITPQPIRNIAPPDFRNHYQHDTLEFGRLFLDLLYKNKITKFFEGEMVTSIECEACKGIRERKEIFLDLIVTLQKDQQELEETIEASLSPEIINDLICDLCNQRRDNSIKRHSLSQIPNYLIVSIKRFQYSVQEKKNHKIMSKILIKPNITLKGEIFDIYSLIIHRGPSPNAGHYFSFSKLNYQPDSKWICHNDSDVSELTDYKEVTDFLDNNESDTPYILFFEKRNHIGKIKEELMKPIQLRKPLEEYVQRDFLQEQKSKQKKVLSLYQPFPFNSLFKKDDDDDDGGQNQPFYNNYVL